MNPQHQHFLMQQQNIASPSASDLDNRRLRMLMSNRTAAIAKDGQSNSVGDMVQGVGSPMQAASPFQRGEADILLKVPHSLVLSHGHWCARHGIPFLSLTAGRIIFILVFFLISATKISLVPFIPCLMWVTFFVQCYTAVISLSLGYGYSMLCTDNDLLKLLVSVVGKLQYSCFLAHLLDTWVTWPTLCSWVSCNNIS